MAGIEAAFPGLTGTDYGVESPQDQTYNCIAWAAEDTERWWWPVGLGGYYWPNGLPRENVLWNFVAAFERLGYEECESTELEPGFLKIAIYAKHTGPTHAARQSSDGAWLSKLGKQVDIRHEQAEDLEGDKYGQIVKVMRRPEDRGA